jgi:putative copper export protein
MGFDPVFCIDAPRTMHLFHLLSIWLHILAAAVWIGGMATLGILLVPLLRREQFEDVATPLLSQSALRFRWIGWGALGVLVVTGLINVRAQGVPWSAWGEPEFWTTAWGAALGWKLLLVVVTLAVTALHDFHVGPKAIRLIQEAPGSPQAKRMRWWSSWLGRLTLLLSLIVLWCAILLPRGGL